jgi:EmrB/QacA subfamily drug resistance transporter
VSVARRRTIFLIVSVALMMSSIDQTIVATALPAFQHELRAQISWAAWTITIYALGRVLILPVSGKLSDQYGRRNIFIIAVSLFTVSSLACGLAGNIYLLIVLRAVQAVGGAAFMPSATGLVSDHFGTDRDRAVGLFTSINPIGGIIGPVLGGLFVAYWSWRGIFLVNVPIGVVLVALAWKYVPTAQGAARNRAPLDVLGMVLLGTAVLAAMFGISFLGNGDVSAGSVGFLLPEAVALLALGLFGWHTSRTAAPFISPRLLRGRGGFGVLNVINFLYGSAALGFAALVPLYATQRYGIASLQSGTLLTARAVGIIAVAGLAALALRRTGYRWPMVVGFTVTAGGLLAMSVAPIGLSPYTWLAVSACLTGIGMGLATPSSNNASLQLAPDQVAAIAGLRGMFRQSGSITAVSITAAIIGRSSTPGVTQAHVFSVFALVLICAVPFIFLVPEHHGRW